jgi:hypothetical protein
MMTVTERVAIVVDPELPAGLLANTVALIAIGLGAAQPRLGGTVLSDRNGCSISNSSSLPVPVLYALPDLLKDILLKALHTTEAGVVVAFPRFARRIHCFEEYRSVFPEHDLAAEVIEGLGVHGPAQWVRSLTGSLGLLR